MDSLPLKARRLGVVIPAYQAVRTLDSVLAEVLRRFEASDVIVVDDGSADGTSEIAMARGAICLRHAANRGKGSALMTGLRAGRDRGWEWALTLDADGQHAAADIEGFRNAVPAPNVGIVIGRRPRRGTSMPWHRRFSNAVTTGFISRLAGVPVYDAQCGFRAYRLDVLDAFPAEGRFEWESQVLVLCGRRGLAVDAVPVTTLYGDTGSHMRLWHDTLRFLRMVGRLSWTC